MSLPLRGCPDGYQLIQPSFAGGEIGPSLYGRIDMAKYRSIARKCDNFIVRQHGGVENRLVRVLSVPPNTQIGNAA